MDHAKLLHTATLAAMHAGDLLKKGFSSSFEIKHKKGKQNLVTEFDLASQKLIINLIREQFPSHSFLAEEGKQTKIIANRPLWIIDPLDGTVNFARSIPQFTISIAAAIKKQIVCAVVYQPMTAELFTAQKNHGAFLNGSPIGVSKTSSLDKSLLATGFPYNVERNPLHCIERMSKMLHRGIPLRRLGSAALDLAYVAAGRFDGYWEVGLHPWDMAAGKLLVEEAGGRVTHYDGENHAIFGYLNLLATNGFLHKKMVSMLKEDIKEAQ